MTDHEEKRDRKRWNTQKFKFQKFKHSKKGKKPQACCISSRINISAFLPGWSACDSATSNPVRSVQVMAKFCIKWHLCSTLHILHADTRLFIHPATRRATLAFTGSRVSAHLLKTASSCSKYQWCRQRVWIKNSKVLDLKKSREMLFFKNAKRSLP